jgi:hypothetical protein
MSIDNKHSDNSELLPSKLYLGTMVECVAAFFISTFCVAMFFSHLGGQWVIPGAILIGLYLFVLGGCIRLLVKRLPIAAMMLITPIVPLVALILILLLMPLLQKLQ